MRQKAILGFLAGITAAAIWGGMYVVSKAVMDVIQPLTLLTLRLALGILTLGLICLIRKGDPIRPKTFWQIFGIGTVGYGISLGFQFVGTNLSTAANGALVTSATPAFVVLFAALLLKERVTLRRLLALLLATLGVLIVIRPEAGQFSSQLFLGNLYLTLAALTWALYSVLMRLATRQTDVLTASLVALAGGLPVSMPLGLWEVAHQGYGTFTLNVLGGILFLGVISTALAMYLWNTAFTYLEAGTASLTFFAQPVVGAVLGVIFLDEVLSPLFLLGGLLIGLGLVLSARE
ncbi:MAG: DMT family transporter [Anaerolineales bacterium]|nr:DMT family transporter [Anaerolineales bacterium]MCX7609054.1 DMT family transporter [Anaerolineales bacterium]MDW8228080.1 DMT family transporter [Anaerolineales bacterium]